MHRGILMPSLWPTKAYSVPYGMPLFITTNNTIVVASYSTGQILIWTNDSTENPTTTIFAGLSHPSSVVVNSDEQIFATNSRHRRASGQMDTERHSTLPNVLSLLNMLWSVYWREQSSLLFCNGSSSSVASIADRSIELFDYRGRNRLFGVDGWDVEESLGNLCDDRSRSLYGWLWERPCATPSIGTKTGN